MKFYKIIRLVFVPLIMALVPMSSFAAGYFGSQNKTFYEGWACNPATPGYSGWIHFWRDDGVFLGALIANIPREAAVGAVCGDAGVHGFSGTLSFPSSYLDNQVHTVRAYFINQDGASSIELQNTVQVLFDGAPVEPPRQSMCNSTLNSAGWVLTGIAHENSCNTPVSINGVSRTYTYVVDMPVGSEITACVNSRLPAGWSVISTSTGSYICQQYIANLGWSAGTDYRIKRMN